MMRKYNTLQFHYTILDELRSEVQTFEQAVTNTSQMYGKVAEVLALLEVLSEAQVALYYHTVEGTDHPAETLCMFYTDKIWPKSKDTYIVAID